MEFIFDNMYDYRRHRTRAWMPRKKGLTKAERYILKINEGCGSRKFKDFLLSKPMDAYMTIIGELKK